MKPSNKRLAISRKFFALGNSRVLRFDVLAAVAALDHSSGGFFRVCQELADDQSDEEYHPRHELREPSIAVGISHEAELRELHPPLFVLEEKRVGVERLEVRAVVSVNFGYT